MVSIIIPVYNAEKFLEECISSALSQTYPEIEIIVINDGSTDSSSLILERFRDKIKIITKQQGGVASARNAGIKKAHGEWIKLLDNDDVLYPTAISDLMNEAALTDNNLKIFYGNVDYIDAQGKIIGDLHEPNYNTLNDFELNTILLDHNYGIPSTWMMHTSVIQQCGLFDEITEHDDYEYHLRACILHHCRFHLVQKKLIKYRIHDQQFTWQVMRKYKNQDAVAMGILNKLDQNLQNEYLLALNSFRKNRTLFEKTAHFFKPILKYLPVTMEIKMRTIYLRLAEKKKFKKSSHELH